MGTERVYISEAEETKKHGLKCIGHTKNYTKVIIDYDPALIGKQIMMKITKCEKWHIEGEILDKECKPEEVNPLYFVDPEEALKKVKKTQKGQKWRFNVNEENGQRDDNLKKDQESDEEIEEEVVENTEEPKQVLHDNSPKVLNS